MDKFRTHLRRTFILVVLSMILLVSFVPPCTTNVVRRPQNVCETSVCLDEAARIKKYMNNSVDPCIDFYQYSCGGFLDTYIIDPSKTSVNHFSIVCEQLSERLRVVIEEELGDDAPIVYKMVQDYYKSCMNTDEIKKLDIKPLKSLLRKLGGWPLVEGENWEPSGFDVFTSASRFQSLGLSNEYLIAFYVSESLSDSTKRIMKLDEPVSLGMPSREYLLKGFEDEKVQAYYNYLVSIAELLGAERERALEEGKNAVMFEIEIAKITTPADDRRDYQKLNNVMSILEMNEQFPLVDWHKYLQNLMPITIVADDEVEVRSPRFIGDMIRLLINTPKRDVANYVIWRAVKDVVGFLPDHFRDLELEYSKVVYGVAQRDPRWQECLSYLTGTWKTFPQAFIGSMYVSKYFDQTAKQRADEMVQYLREEFYKILENLSWMDPKTKRRAFEKAEAIIPSIGYPDEILDYEKLYATVKGLKILPGDFMMNHLRAIAHDKQRNYRKLRKPVDKRDWETKAVPAMVNAFYIPWENTILFPAGILQGAFFHKNRPNYLNFGFIGSIIGHEITHGFDDMGRNFDSKGDLVSWWEPETNRVFLEKANCVIEQYSDFIVEELGKNVNGKLTQGENIADNGGVKETYNAYLQWEKVNGEEPLLPGVDLNQRQLLWLSASQLWCGKNRPEAALQWLLTDPHAPDAARGSIPLQNNKEFAHDFNCPLGSPMNPEDKCVVW